MMIKMNKIEQADDRPYFILVFQDYIIGTPKGIAESDDTIDIHFDEFIKDKDLQTKLELASALYVGQHNAKDFAIAYLSAFNSDTENSEKIKNYLQNNGLLRILINSDNLRKKIKQKK